MGMPFSLSYNLYIDMMNSLVLRHLGKYYINRSCMFVLYYGDIQEIIANYQFKAATLKQVITSK